jgi:hypothetical protein
LVVVVVVGVGLAVVVVVVVVVLVVGVVVVVIRLRVGVSAVLVWFGEEGGGKLVVVVWLGKGGCGGEGGRDRFFFLGEEVGDGRRERLELVLGRVQRQVRENGGDDEDGHARVERAVCFRVLGDVPGGRARPRGDHDEVWRGGFAASAAEFGGWAGREAEGRG